ncbi:methyltransferase [Moraxella caviae]|uniref:Methyltransferase n=1 Tax=Moraxella caviae TaxID=34060 RepID=A0A1S9ZW71_9GAMM|nr:methyltransferase [Moraxella caviae]OOR87786.1 methyltransferase [Moraxella caviae]STZ10540.1 Ribosomal RNA large subunit methyltransferase G [Moraxella caviae]VEW11341.1 Ribosomal RNA large subunit methyltransferase G [Moraxella caviae]
MTETTLADLQKRAKLWREDITFSEDVLGKPFHFRTTWGIFSPEKLDDGSLMLLDHIDFRADDSSIDLGCGYGVLGMTAARECPNGEHLLIDKDFVAVEYAKINCKNNGLTNAQVQLSNGFNDVDKARKFSLVMSNLPAKVGKEQHYLYLLDAYERMEVGARFYVVTINGLRQFMKRAFTEVFGNADKVKQGKTYTITMATKL